MADLTVEDPSSGQLAVQPLTTKNAVSNAGTLVRPQEPVTIIGTGVSEKMPVNFLGEDEHVVHRIQAAKLVKKGAAKYKNKEDEQKQAEIEKAEKEAKK